MISLINNFNLRFISDGWENVKHFFKTIEPYQPMVATVSILSKAAYKSRLNRDKANRIRDLANRLKVVQTIERGRKIPLNKAKTLRYLLHKEETDQLHIRIALLQLVSLLYKHPGANIWNSAITLLGRFASISHYFSYVNEEPTNKMNGILGILSTLGTGVAFLNQVGAIAEYTPPCHGIIGISFVSMALETVLMLKTWFTRE